MRKGEMEKGGKSGKGHSKELLRLENDCVLPSLLIKDEDKTAEKRIFRLPESKALGSIKDFLPKMKKANEDLKRIMEDCPEDVNIENVGDDDDVIEMNLGLIEYSGESDSNTSQDSSEEDDEEKSEDDKPNCKTKKDH